MLALALGGRSVEEWQAVISEAEFQTWMRVYAAFPFGERAAFYRSGLIASMIANQNRDPKKRKDPFTAQDFMPKDPLAAVDELPPSEQFRNDFLGAFGGRIKKEDGRDS